MQAPAQAKGRSQEEMSGNISIGLPDYITKGGSYGSQLYDDHDSVEGDIS